MASGLGFLALGVRSSPVKKPEMTKVEKDQQTRKATAVRKAKKVVFVALVCVFLFLYVGAEIALGAYLTIFCVRSGVCYEWEGWRGDEYMVVHLVG